VALGKAAALAVFFMAAFRKFVSRKNKTYRTLSFKAGNHRWFCPRLVALYAAGQEGAVPRQDTCRSAARSPSGKEAVQAACCGLHSTGSRPDVPL
jgi:hypothetical protein